MKIFRVEHEEGMGECGSTTIILGTYDNVDAARKFKDKYIGDELAELRVVKDESMVVGFFEDPTFGGVFEECHFMTSHQRAGKDDHVHADLNIVRLIEENLK